MLFSGGKLPSHPHSSVRGDTLIKDRYIHDETGSVRKDSSFGADRDILGIHAIMFEAKPITLSQIHSFVWCRVEEGGHDDYQDLPSSFIA
jgi:hypothetical protein